MFLNCQDEQIPKLSLDLHFVQQLKEVSMLFAGEGAGGQDCIWSDCEISRSLDEG